MNLTTIKDVVTSKTARQVLLTQKHSPKILFVAGTVGVVTATVLACRATLKMNDVLDEADKKRTNINNFGASEETQQKELHKLQINTAIEIVKLYAPSIVIGSASIAALTGSHVILSKRNGAVMAAYAGLDRAYKEYRQRVSEEYGTDVDRKFAVGRETVLVEEKTSDGKTKTTAASKLGGKYGGSPYSIVFDEFSKRFSREPGMNAMFIQMQQNYANDKLRANGHLFLNEVYDMLGVARTKAGACVGWVYRHDSEEKTGDNYVSFGVFEGMAEDVEAFIDGVENRIVLDFNVDGMILDLI